MIWCKTYKNTKKIIKMINAHDLIYRQITGLERFQGQLINAYSAESVDVQNKDSARTAI